MIITSTHPSVGYCTEKNRVIELSTCFTDKMNKIKYWRFFSLDIMRRKKPIAFVKNYLYRKNNKYYTVEHCCIIWTVKINKENSMSLCIDI